MTEPKEENVQEKAPEASQPAAPAAPAPAAAPTAAPAAAPAAAPSRPEGGHRREGGPRRDGPRGPRREGGPGGRRPRKQYFRKRKVCRFCVERVDYIDYKKADALQGFVQDRGKVLPRRLTGTCSRHQR